ncbi:MAG: Eco57I restriction-modification methylase domain-containing protein [Nitrososphaerota archaeon]|nr:Eco57I restriction-modification methylase domain-containing protein [Nitrososphaerota archaeon]
MINNSSYNPDVLSCIASLSSDEVFTPPQLTNRILDLLPVELWSDKNATFLDPCCKSGVFLREVAKRLDKGLEKQFPDRRKRMNHVFSAQLFGIGITELTALLSRRSVYCSKTANGKYSVCDAFSDPQGNIRFKRANHIWEEEHCVYCGASREAYDRGPELETHAYNFIHRETPEEVLNMKFDVIIGNPPYQLGSDGGTRDIPIYNKFVEQAKRLNPRFLCMVIPSRWMASGLGLSEFRSTMLRDRHIRKLVDYPVASEVFSGVEIKGGVCYFLWDRDTEGDCEVTTVRGGNATGPVRRNLGEFDVFVRDSRALGVLHKVQHSNEPSIATILSVDKEFGWTSNFNGFHDTRKGGDVPIYYIRKSKRDIGWIGRAEIDKSANLIDTWKVLVPKAGSDGGQRLPDSVLGKPLIVASPSVCTQSFLFFYVKSGRAARSIESYLRTKFFRFLVSLRKITQDATHSTYTWVPRQSWDRVWTDEALYKKYKLTKEDIAFIEMSISPMPSMPTDPADE